MLNQDMQLFAIIQLPVLGVHVCVLSTDRVLIKCFSVKNFKRAHQL